MQCQVQNLSEQATQIGNNTINGCVFYSTWCNPGIYLAVLFYQPGKKLPNSFTQFVEKNG